MTRATRATMLILSVSLAPCVAHAQDQAQATPQGNPERKEIGLPSKVKWPFNLDAGWGTFGFGNSLFDNPKERGVTENLSDQWFEGYIKPALSGVYTFQSSSEIYGKVSGVGERTYGSVPAVFGQDVSSFQAEDLHIGWRSGKSLRAGENALDFTVGRTQYRLGHGFLLYDGAAEGGSRGGTGPTRGRRSSLPPSAGSIPALTKSKPSISTKTSSKRPTAAADCTGSTTKSRSAAKSRRRSVRPT